MHMALAWCCEFRHGMLPRLNESSRHTDTEKADSCNASFGSYSTRQSPPRETVTTNVHLLFVKGKVHWSSKEYDLEMDTAHKGLIMPIHCQ